MTKPEKLLKVIDSSCTVEYPVREHHIKVGNDIIPVTFKYGEDKFLPLEQGAKFRALGGFTVTEADGTVLEIGVAKESFKAELAADEVVAKLSELTMLSLQVRAGQKPGGEIYLDAAEESRADLIAFLIGMPPVAGADETKPLLAGADDGDLVSDDEDDERGAAGLKGELNVQPVAPLNVNVITGFDPGSDEGDMSGEIDVGAFVPEMEIDAQLMEPSAPPAAAPIVEETEPKAE